MNELFAKRATAWEAAKRFLDTHTLENGTLSAEDAATYERMEAEIQAITDQIERKQRLEQMENSMKEPVTTPIVEKPANSGTEKNGRASDAYKKSFINYIRGQHFANDITPLMKEGTAADGGYLVPEEFELLPTLWRSPDRVLPTRDPNRVQAEFDTLDGGWLLAIIDCRSGFKSIQKRKAPGGIT